MLCVCVFIYWGHINFIDALWPPPPVAVVAVVVSSFSIDRDWKWPSAGHSPLGVKQLARTPPLPLLTPAAFFYNHNLSERTYWLKLNLLIRKNNYLPLLNVSQKVLKEILQLKNHLECILNDFRLPLYCPFDNRVHNYKFIWCVISRVAIPPVLNETCPIY